MHSILPIEVYRLIIEQVVHKSTLLCVLVTSRAFSMEAERRLYRTINCTDDDLFEFMENITRPGRQRLARYVHSFSFIGDYHIPASEYQPITDGLRTLTNLKRFSFTSCGCSPCASIILPPDPRPFQLEYLDLDCRGDEDFLSVFLTNQKHLKLLYLPSWDNEKLYLPSTALQTLQTLCGSVRTIKKFLPGRPNITTLGWDMPVTVGMSLDDMPSFSKIRFFSFGFFGRPHISTIVSQLNSVEILEIQNPQIDEIFAMHTMSHLHTLVLTFDSTDLFPGSIRIEDIFANMKNVKRVDVAILDDSDDPLLFQRWDRGLRESEPMIIEPHVALHWKEWNSWNWIDEQWS